MSAVLTRSSFEQLWTFEDRTVTQLVVDPGAFRLQTRALDGWAEVRVGVPFALRPAGRAPLLLDPEEARELAPALGLLGVGLRSIRVRRTGELRVEFADDSVLEVEPHPTFEAWEISGGESLAGLAYLCGPGGGSPWG
ncbi:MAG TPA: DUF6188 family protein [Gemmatimonadales bacterium]|nr:DUF6188 family protein [Gemmatimonadales bacterium]